MTSAGFHLQKVGSDVRSLLVFASSHQTRGRKKKQNTCRRGTTLLQGDELGAMGGTDTGATVLDGLVGQRELGQVVGDHLSLDLNSVELLAVVDTDDGADHLGHDDHVAQVGADGLGLLTNLHELLGLAELLHQGHGLALETASETATSTGVDHLGELLVLEGQKGLDLEATVLELVELTLLLQLLVAGLVHLGRHAGQ
eukprot:514089_1